MITGVYYIKNKVNNKIYVGSSKDITLRKVQHFSELRGGYHQNIHLQRSYDKYGESNFEFGILEVVEDMNSLYDREQFYIDLYYDNSCNCYNINPKASKPPVSCRPCAIYNKEGKFIKYFKSLKECGDFLNREIHTIIGAIQRGNSLCGGKYMIRYVEGENVIKNIKPYKNTPETLYELDIGTKQILKTYSNVEEIMNTFKVNVNKATLYKAIVQGYKFKNRLFIKESKYMEYMEGTYNRKLSAYKYLLTFDIFGNLVKTVNNSYGKFNTKDLNRVTKNNNNIYYKNLNKRYALYKGYIYLKSNEIINYIPTNIKIYQVYDIRTNKIILESLTLKGLCTDLGISKGTWEYYSTEGKCNENYKYKTITY